MTRLVKYERKRLNPGKGFGTTSSSDVGEAQEGVADESSSARSDTCMSEAHGAAKAVEFTTIQQHPKGEAIDLSDGEDDEDEDASCSTPAKYSLHELTNTPKTTVKFY